MSARVPSRPPAPPLRSDGQRARVLVVDDEVGLAVALREALAAAGWEAVVAHDGARAVAVAGRFRPDVVVLDVMLPDGSGLRVLDDLRRLDERVAVLFLTARDAVADRIEGIAVGGDDYLTKPFHLDELMARLRGLLRRTGVIAPSRTVLQVGDLRMDEDAREVDRAGRPVTLSVTEFELLRCLMRHPRTVLSKADLLDRVWHYDFGGKAHVVELYVSYLRKKIDSGREPMIHTVRGAGYVLRPHP